jgi:cytochrome c oxidase cbb3-type subunit 3
MSDFTSGFWGIYISVVTVVSIAACALFLWSQQTRKVSGKVGTTGHVWDEDLAEWNNPLPNWWRWLFYITLVFGLAYLVAFPGLGMWKGALDWSSVGQYDAEQKRAAEVYGPIFAKFAKTDIEQLAQDPAAMAVGQSLYLNYCAACHASDARGGKGFPNLTDADWLYGADPKVIQETILNGRNGVMPPFGPVLGPEGVKDVANYVLSLSGAPADSVRVARGQEKFAQLCVACHGPEGKGNPALGAPNLTDKIWLYGAGEATVIETITAGRNNRMPAWKDFLGEEKVHVLAAYVWSLSHKPASGNK